MLNTKILASRYYETKQCTQGESSLILYEHT